MGPGGWRGAGGWQDPTATIIIPGTVPKWMQFDFTYLDFSGGSPIPELIFYTLPMGYIIDGFKLYVTQAFAGPGITSYQMQCGIAAALDLFTAYWEMVNPVTGIVDVPAPFTFGANQLAGEPLQLTALADAPTNLATQGAFSVWLRIQNP